MKGSVIVNNACNQSRNERIMKGRASRRRPIGFIVGNKERSTACNNDVEKPTIYGLFLDKIYHLFLVLFFYLAVLSFRKLLTVSPLGKKELKLLSCLSSCLLEALSCDLSRCYICLSNLGRFPFDAF